MQLSVSVSDLTLDAGRVFDNGDNRLRIAPPDRPMFEQIREWLYAQPSPPYAGFPHYVLGIGAAALCLRSHPRALPFTRPAQANVDHRCRRLRFLGWIPSGTGPTTWGLSDFAGVWGSSG